MNLFKKKEVHYVLTGAIAKILNNASSFYERTDLESFESKELAQRFIQDKILGGSRYTYRILKEVEVWEAETVYKKTLDNTQR